MDSACYLPSFSLISFVSEGLFVQDSTSLRSYYNSPALREKEKACECASRNLFLPRLTVHSPAGVRKEGHKNVRPHGSCEGVGWEYKTTKRSNFVFTLFYAPPSFFQRTCQLRPQLFLTTQKPFDPVWQTLLIIIRGFTLREDDHERRRRGRYSRYLLNWHPEQHAQERGITRERGQHRMH